MQTIPISWEKIDDAIDLEFGGDRLRMALTAQIALDEYLGWLREDQWKWLHQEVRELKSITRPPDLDEYRRLDNLRSARIILSRPLPSMGGFAAADEVQTPPPILAWKSLIDALSTPAPNQTVYPEHLKKLRAHCLQMLLRSVVFLSEAFSYLDINKMLRYMRQGMTKEEVMAKPFDLFLSTKAPTTGQDAETFSALLRVSSALVATPLRMYQEVTLERHDLRHEGIEELIQDGFEQSALDSLRNAVFHVPKLTIDPFQIDSNQAMQAEAMALLLGHLAEFYGSVRQ